MPNSGLLVRSFATAFGVYVRHCRVVSRQVMMPEGGWGGSCRHSSRNFLCHGPCAIGHRSQTAFDGRIRAERCRIPDYGLACFVGGLAKPRNSILITPNVQ